MEFKFFIYLNLYLFGYVSCLKDSPPVIQTKYGQIQGTTDGLAYLYLGIPYALPPIDELRWEEPIRVKPWQPKILNATWYKPSCPQSHGSSCDPPGTCPLEYGEDCLYLNVFTPKTIFNSDKKAVMVFIHGGNFQYGGTSPLLYNSSTLANYGDVIVVSIGYRLGALGFLVTGLEDDQFHGNYGILDQKIALQWIYENVESFGGDSERITIFGQSAGAQSVSIHLLSPDVQPYFTNAIVMSSPYSIPFRTYEEMAGLYMYLADGLNCTARDIQCLRSKTVDEIINAQMNAETKPSSIKFLEFFEPWLPWIDGKIIKGQLLDVEKWQQAENFTYKPFIIGTLPQECVYFIYVGFTSPIDLETYIEIIIASFKQHGLDMLERYPPDLNNSDQRDRMTIISTQWTFSCSTRYFLEKYMTLSQSTSNNSYYMYVFDYPLDWPGWGSATFCNNKTCHAGDLPYTFDNPDGNFTLNGHLLAYQHMSYWSNYAKYGTPNGNGDYIKNDKTLGDLVYWPKYDSNARADLRFKSQPLTIENDYLVHECDYFDSIGYYYKKAK